ncbi:hypothetical protein [Streptomyces sp. NPDC014685]|uniref:hypothetical protein n=1 Tax=Streptomyces sp. NPDC014685 TaxID=3364881 RepID=UPI0037015E87
MTVPMTPEQRKAIAYQLGDAKPATDALLGSLAESVANVRDHEHPKWEDLFCMNLSSYMGERMAPVLRRLLDIEVERDALRARVAELEALKPAPVQTCRTCGAGYDYGQPCSVCEFKKRMAAAIAAPVEKDTPAGESTPQAITVESYPDELSMLRGLLGVIRAVAKHGDMEEVRRLLAEHASDEQAAYAEVTS